MSGILDFFLRTKRDRVFHTIALSWISVVGWVGFVFGVRPGLPWYTRPLLGVTALACVLAARFCWTYQSKHQPRHQHDG